MNVFSGVGLLLVVVAIGLGIGAIFATGDAQGGLFITAVSLLPTGLIFFAVGRRVGGFKMLRPRLLEYGTPARGLVTKIWETGVTVNNSPVLGFELNVLSDDGPPRAVSVQQAVPRMLVGAVLPGSVLAVETDPKDPSSIAIDWSVTPERPAVVSDGDDDPIETLPTRTESVARLLTIGREARATITAMRRMGSLDDMGLAPPGSPRSGDELFLIELDVHSAGMDPIAARVLHRVPEELVGRVGPGLEVPVRVSRQNPAEDLAIDWAQLS